MIIDFNCDMGESYGPYTAGLDEQVMPHITSANVACGFHAGDPMHMETTVLMAERAGVGIGAHPGFQDIMGFGRREIAAHPEEAKNYVKYQIGALLAFTKEKKIQHVKAHGALYNMGVRDFSIARAVAEAVRAVDSEMILVGLAGSNWIDAGREAGLRVAREVFADRAVNPDGSLVSRKIAGAVIHDVNEVVARTLKIVTEGRLTAINGEEIDFSGDTVCLHGDTPGAVELAQTLRKELEAASVTVARMGTFL